MDKKQNLLYIFGSGRKERIAQSNINSKEFFYGYFSFEEEFGEIDIVEMLPSDTFVKGLRKFTEIIDKVLRKLSNLPFFFHLIFSFENFKKIIRSTHIVSTNDRLGLSILPMYLISKLFSRKKLSVIVMGLFSKPKGNLITNIFQKLFLKLFLISSSSFIFLGEGEYRHAINLFPNFKNKFYSVPFGINTNFWLDRGQKIFQDRDYILFVGNDGNRDFDALVKIVNSNKEINFIVVSKQLKIDDFEYNNITLHYGDWFNQTITDSELKNLYKNAKFTIIPLKESLQPSGQSVCLQSMSVGTPVIITKTDGFWDPDRFETNENILFIQSNNTEDWNKLIKDLYSNNQILEKISKNSQQTIKDFYDEKFFIEKLKKIVFI
jgi:glycosyltransferase involved in cell wall biosynthesis